MRFVAPDKIVLRWDQKKQWFTRAFSQKSALELAATTQSVLAGAPIGPRELRRREPPGFEPGTFPGTLERSLVAESNRGLKAPSNSTGDSPQNDVPPGNNALPRCRNLRSAGGHLADG